MFRRSFTLIAASLLLSALPASALRIDDLTVVIPVVIHGPGADSTQWRTDLWISNPNTAQQYVTVTYEPNGGSTLTFGVHVPSFGTVQIPDVVLSKFGLDDSKGMLLIHSATGAKVSARARIFNVGNPVGEFGQFVPGLGLGQLSSQGFIPGVSGLGGNRTNMGLANPNDRDISLDVNLLDGDGNDLGGTSVTVPARSVVQLNDVFASLGIPPRDNAQIRVQTIYVADIFYAYASVVRDRSGDAIFIFGTSPNQ